MSKSFMIESFMTGSLGLSGNELVLFAILWKESDRGKKKVVGDYTAISQRMGTTVPTMYNCIKKLMDRGFVTMPVKGMYEIHKVKVA